MRMKTTFKSFFSHENFLFLMSFPGPYWPPAFMEKLEVFSVGAASAAKGFLRSTRRH